MTYLPNSAAAEIRMYWILASDMERAVRESDGQLLADTIDELDVLSEKAEVTTVAEKCRALLAKAESFFVRTA